MGITSQCGDDKSQYGHQIPIWGGGGGGRQIPIWASNPNVGTTSANMGTKSQCGEGKFQYEHQISVLTTNPNNIMGIKSQCRQMSVWATNPNNFYEHQISVWATQTNMETTRGRIAQIAERPTEKPGATY